MIKVLKKALDVLECLKRSSDTPMLISDIARETDIPVATCGRILKTLVDADYVEAAGVKRGFLLGPMSYSLGGGESYRKDLLRVAEPLMLELAKEVDETVVMAMLHRGRRYTIAQIEGGQEVQINSDTVLHDDLYRTATGRLMLSWLDEDELEFALLRNGFPPKTWPEASTRESMAAEMEKIRQEGNVVIFRETHVIHVAYPIFENGRAVAGLGIFLPEHRYADEHKTAVHEGLDRTAKIITERVKSEYGRGRPQRR